MKQAFSLIELLVVISLAAILAGVTLTALPRFSQKIALDSSARLVASQLRKIQTEASTEHATKVFLPADCQLPPGISYSYSSSLSFAPSGYPTVGGSGTLVLLNRYGQKKKIILSSAGRVRIE